MENCFNHQTTRTSLPNKMLLDLDKEVEKIDSTRELSLLTAPLAESENFHNSPFILNEEDELPWVDSMENELTSMTHLNEDTELNQVKMTQLSQDPCMHKEKNPEPIIIVNLESNQNAKNECILNMSDPIWVIALDKSKDCFKEIDIPQEVPVKSNTSEILDEIEEWPEFVEWKKEQGLLESKEEDFNQNQIASKDCFKEIDIPQEVPVKSNTSEILDEIEEWPEFVEWKKEQGLLESKEEDFNQNQIAILSAKSNQRKRSQAKTHKCHICSYQTNRKFNLNEHLLRHKKPEEVQMFKCDKCEFETIYKKSLKAHLLQQHKNWKELDHFQCDKCNFKTIYKHSLKTHLLQHKNPKTIDLYKCNQCKYETMHKSALKKHALQHKKPKVVSTFKCSQCDFKTIGRAYLQKHLRVHRDPKEI